MGIVHMPPPGGFIGKGKTCCLPHDEPLFINFKHTGFFWPSQNDAFESVLPTGVVYQGSGIGPFVPSQNNIDIELNLFSFEDRRIHIRTIQIRTTCKKNKCEDE